VAGDQLNPPEVTPLPNGPNPPAPVTFTITPVSFGARTISFTNNAGLADPTPKTYTARGRLTLTAPATRQGYQRSLTTNSARVTVSGSYGGAGGAIQVRFVYTAPDASVRSTGWLPLGTTGAGGAFTGTIDLPTGYGRLDVRAAAEPSATASVPLISIGDVWAGGPQQSNGSGRRLTATDTAGHPGCVMFTNAYTWGPLADPTDSAVGQVDVVSGDATNNPAGSVWPRLFARLAHATGVPQIFIPCARGGSSVTGVSNTPSWAPATGRTTLYGSMIHRVRQAGGCRAALSRLTESDMRYGTTGAQYVQGMLTIVQSIHADLGVPTVVPTCHRCKTSWASIARQEEMRQAVTDLVAASPHALRGPDLYPLIDSGSEEMNAPGDEVHIVGDPATEIEVHAWFTILKQLFY
jgi:hypothetical protein